MRKLRLLILLFFIGLFSDTQNPFNEMLAQWGGGSTAGCASLQLCAGAKAVKIPHILEQSSLFLSSYIFELLSSAAFYALVSPPG